MFTIIWKPWQRTTAHASAHTVLFQYLFYPRHIKFGVERLAKGLLSPGILIIGSFESGDDENKLTAEEKVVFQTDTTE